MDMRGNIGGSRRRPLRKQTVQSLLATSAMAFGLLLATSPASRATTNEESAAKAQTDVIVAAEALETYATDNNGSYRGATGNLLRRIEPALHDVRLNVRSQRDGYRLAVRSSAKPFVVFRLIRNADGTVKRTCGPRGRTGCSIDGTWVLLRLPPTPESIDAEAKAGVVTAAEAMETCATDNNGVYSLTSCTVADLRVIEPTLNDLGARLTVTPTGSGYEIVVMSDRAWSVAFRLRRLSNGTTLRTCATGGAPSGGCPASGVW